MESLEHETSGAYERGEGTLATPEVLRALAEESIGNHNRETSAITTCAELLGLVPAKIEP